MMHWIHKLGWLLVAVAAGVGVARADSPDIAELSGGAKLDALIAEVSQRQKSLGSLRARFVQVKESELLAEPVEATGTLSFAAPDRVRWDYAAPQPMVIVVADGLLTTYHPELARAEVVKVSRGQRRLVGIIAGSQSLEDIRSRFRISLADRADEPYHLTLEPATMAVKRRLDEIRIDIDRELLLPVTVEYLEADGDRTRYDFSAMELNPSVDEAVFRLELGDEVVVETVDASASGG